MSTNDQLKDEIRCRIKSADKTLPTEDYPFPLNIIVEPTNNCNLKCIMCPSKDQNRERGVMSLELWKRIVDEVAVKSPSSTIWPAIMGEGLVAGKVFLDMLSYACEKGVRLIWNTNAELLNRTALSRITQLPILQIIVGIDAATRETYEKVRIGGNFDSVRDNTLKLLQQKNPKTEVVVQFIEQEENSRELADFKSFWLDNGAVVKIRPRLGWGEGVDAPELILDQCERVGPCPWLVRTVSIHWDGHAVQCDADWDRQYSAGHLDHSSIEEIWTGELAARRERHRQMDFDFEPCNSCKDWQAGLSEVFYPSGHEKHKPS